MTPVAQKEKRGFLGYFGGERGYLIKDSEDDVSFENQSLFEEIRRLNGVPVWEDVKDSKIVNETMIEKLTIDYDKGCFLGQETASKIKNGRGPSTFPMLLKTQKGELKKGDFFIEGVKAGRICDFLKTSWGEFYFANIKRDFRVSNSTCKITQGEKKESVTILSYPFFKDTTQDEKSEELFLIAFDLFKKDQLDDALAILERVLEINPKHEDACEFSGVIYGRQKNGISVWR